MLFLNKRSSSKQVHDSMARQVFRRVCAQKLASDLTFDFVSHHSNVPSLPSELILYILELATTPTTNSSNPSSHQTTLANFALINRHIAQWSRRRLYDSPIVTSTKQMALLTRTLDRDIEGEMTRLVKRLIVDGLDRSTRIKGFRMNVTRGLPKLLQALSTKDVKLESLDVLNALVLSTDDFALPERGNDGVWSSTLRAFNLGAKRRQTEYRPSSLQIDHLVLSNTVIVDSRPRSSSNSAYRNVVSSTRQLTLVDTSFSPSSSSQFLSPITFNDLSRLHVKGVVSLVSDPLMMRNLGTFNFDSSTSPSAVDEQRDERTDDCKDTLLDKLSSIRLSPSNTAMVSAANDSALVLETQESILSSITKYKHRLDSVKELDVSFKVLYGNDEQQYLKFVESPSLRQLTIRGAARHVPSAHKRPYEWTSEEKWIKVLVEACAKHQVVLRLK
ncbi:hypothetical protein ACM66B_001254 [Microbotryomycetes sp. NB124-2]